jgi:predicted dehydrogenase
VPDRTFGWGISATGKIAHQFARGLRQLDDAEIVAIESRTQARAEEFGDEFSIAHRHGSADALAADDAVEIVYVASPNSQHAPDTLRYLEAGKHVLCEKPFALNEAEARLMVDAARTRGLFLMEAIWSRFLPSYQLLGRLLADRVIGEPLLVEGDFGFRRPIDPADRLFDPALGGGALLDLGIYPVQLASLVLGTPDSISAQAHVGETGVDEQVAALLHHPSGALAVVKAAIRVSMTCTARIAGTDGVIDLPAFMHCPGHLVVTTGAGVERHDAPVEGEGLRYEAMEVQRCVRDGLTESPSLRLAETITITRTLDTIRGQIGVVYPGEAPLRSLCPHRAVGGPGMCYH